MKIYQLMQRRECFNTYGMERKHNQHWQFLEDELIAEIQNFALEVEPVFRPVAPL